MLHKSVLEKITDKILNGQEEDEVWDETTGDYIHYILHIDKWNRDKHEEHLSQTSKTHKKGF